MEASGCSQYVTSGTARLGRGGNRSQIQKLIHDLDEDDERLFWGVGYVEFISPLRKKGYLF